MADLERVVHEDPRSIFSVLRDIEQFRDFRVNFDTVCWASGLDLAPEYLYFLALDDDPALQDQFEQWGYAHTEVPRDA